MHKAIHYLRKLAPWAILTFTLAAGIATSTAVYLSAGGGFPTSELSGDILGDLEQAEPSLLDRLASNVGALGFAIACGGTLMVNLLLAHRLLTWIEANLREITGTRAKAKSAKKDIQAIRACDQAANVVLEQCSNELARLGSPTSYTDSVTDDIIAAIRRGIARYETRLTELAVRKQDTASRFTGLHDDLNEEELHKRVAVLRAIGFTDVNPHVRGKGRGVTAPIAAGVHHETVH